VFTDKLEIYPQRFIFVIDSLFIKMVFTLYIFNIYCILAANKCQLSSLSHNRHNLYFLNVNETKKHQYFSIVSLPTDSIIVDHAVYVVQDCRRKIFARFFKFGYNS
jgi:hypothetical protein